MKNVIMIGGIAILIAWGVFFTVYRFKNPSKTQTELFFDIFNGNMFGKK